MNKLPRPRNAPDAIPEAFCWTKMGVEAGEGLSAIICRKEWERKAGGGLFFWGIGNSLGGAVHALAQTVEHPEVLFSPIRSKPRLVDVAPEAVQLWMTYLDADGREVPLPWSSWVTSRAAGESRSTPHYALACKSQSELHASTADGHISFGRLRNLTTGRKLGFSQVTSVVTHDKKHDGAGGDAIYPISLRAHLVAPYYVRLCKSVSLNQADVDAQAELVDSGNSSAWTEWVRAAKQRFWKALSQSTATTLEQQLPLRL